MGDQAQVTIRFCVRCRWWLRAGYLAQECFSTFGDQLAVCLQPGAGGEFSLWTGDHCLWDRQQEGGFPEPQLLKQRIRAALFPDQDLGHSEPPR